MRRFLIKSTVFVIFPILYFGINIGVNKYIYRNQTVPLKDINVLIAGDSHPQRSVNPKYFTSAHNISQLAEPYIITYWKLKKVFNTVIPDTLILGFAPHNISQFNNLKFSNDEWSGEMFKRCYPIEELNSISKNISIDYPAFYKVLWKHTAFYPKNNHINYLGNYSNSKLSDVSDWEISIQRHYYYEDKELNISNFEINNLDSIIKLCDSKNIVLVLVSNPVYNKYLENIPSGIVKEYIRLTKEYNIDHIVFDRTREKYPDSLYLNSDHLNEDGAKRFTTELMEFFMDKAQTTNDVF